MEKKEIWDYTKEDLLDLLNENVDAIAIVDSKLNKYRAITRKGIFVKLLDESGDYTDLIQKLWFHLENSREEITDDYKAFASYYGEFKGKYSRRIKIHLEENDNPHVIQMNVYPFGDAGKYVFAMDELDSDEYVEEYMTSRKVNTIQNTFLFSMIADLNADTIDSLSVTEVSEDTVQASLAYSQWRMMIVNMIRQEDQKLFLMFTDPEYLRENLAVGAQTSFDCMMKNLEGEFIWVKLIFSRADTGNDEDFRFVFMVQDINETTTQLMATLKKYEILAHKDQLTGLMNRAGLEPMITQAIDDYKNGGESVSLVMIDLDNFKSVNDTYGHAVGDNTLKAIGSLIQSSLDGKGAFAGRWGGEEFVASFVGLARDEVFNVAESFRQKVELEDFGQAGHLTCSIGLSSLRQEDTFVDIFNRVDQAMYASKRSGRNRVTEV